MTKGLSSTERLRIGILGGGVTSAVGRAHISAIRLSGQYEIISACFSSNADSNDESAVAYGLSRDLLSGGLSEMLAQHDGDLDAVVVLTPTPQHVKQVGEVLDSGLSVICEKSLATSAQDAQALVAACLHDQKLFVCYNYSAYPMVREAAARIRQGALGHLHTLRISMPSEYFMRRDKRGNPLRPQLWREEDYQIPTVSLDLGVHVVHLAHYLSSTHASRVVARENHHGLVEGVVDSVEALGQYGSKLDVSLDFGKVFLGERNGLRIRAFGTEGSLEWFQQVPDVLTIADRYGNRSQIDPGSPDLLAAGAERYARFKAGHPTGFVEAFANLYDDFAEGLRQHNLHQDLPGDLPCGSDALQGLIELEAMHLSSQSGAWIDVGH